MSAFASTRSLQTSKEPHQLRDVQPMSSVAFGSALASSSCLTNCMTLILFFGRERKIPTQPRRLHQRWHRETEWRRMLSVDVLQLLDHILQRQQLLPMPFGIVLILFFRSSRSNSVGRFSANGNLFFGQSNRLCVLCPNVPFIRVYKKSFRCQGGQYQFTKNHSDVKAGSTIMYTTRPMNEFMPGKNMNFKTLTLNPTFARVVQPLN